jgi:hypothetical protein
MDKFIAILIECDNSRSLGGSCERDLYNIYQQLIINKVNSNNIFILSNNIQYFINKNIKVNICDNSIIQIENILMKTNNNSSFYFHISGHGYQGNDMRHIEIDNNCEQIILSSGVLTDYMFNDMIMKYLNKDTLIRISVDTCHSGTFSNFCNQLISVNNKIQVTKKQPYFSNAYSISACKDMELDSCDVGNTVGFGGSLTVHLLDNNNFNEFILGDPIKVRDNLIPILKELNQEPILLFDN